MSSAPPPDDEEDRLIRVVALQNAAAVLSERVRIERDLQTERERLRITLASIGDAVISTDVDGLVVFLNSVAEKLTGWRQAEAVGRPLAEVFRIVDEATRAAAPNPALRALQEGRVVELANHTLLLSRDGREWPIDDSAAPMRDESGAAIGAVLVFRDVSDRRQADRNHAELAAIIESSEDAIFSLSLDGVIRSWNPGAERLFGHAAADAIGRTIALFVPPELAEEQGEILQRLRRGERVEHFETVRLTRDGARIEVSLSVSPLRNKAGEIVGASKIARDITQRRQAERRQRLLAELSAATQGQGDPAALATTTARLLGEHLDADRCAYAEIEDETLFQVAGDHAEGLPSLVGEWPVASFGDECGRCLRANEPYVIEDLRGGGTGTLQAVGAMLCVPLHKEGRPVAAMIVHQRIARRWTPAEIDLVATVTERCWEALERARMARGLLETANRLALTLEAAHLGDWTWEAEGGVVTLSPRAAEIFGLSREAPIDRPHLLTAIHEADRERVGRSFEAAVAQAGSYEAEYRVCHPDGTEVWVSAKGRAHHGANGAVNGLYGVVQDITRSKQLQGELERRAAELAEADRQKDDSIALLAHELRNPLAPVRTALQLIRLAGEDLPAIERARAVMDRQVAHMARLIDDLLDVSRLGRNKLDLRREPVVLGDAVQHAVETASSAIKSAGHRFEVALPPEPIVLHADLTRLAQVFGNLLANSAKFTPKGGRIRLGARRVGHEVVVTVEDDGIGIPVGSLPRVFEMFAQVHRGTERMGGGLGIGLALVRGLVEAHGGRVEAASAGSGKGSTFTVWLPMAEDQTVTGAPAPLETVAIPRKRVLVADDSEDGAAMLVELVGLLGHEAEMVHDGLSAVTKTDSYRPDIIFMDVGMPVLDGLEATRRIRATPFGASVKIVALTGWGQDIDRQHSRDAGCDAHVVKPLSFAALQEVLASLNAA